MTDNLSVEERTALANANRKVRAGRDIERLKYKVDKMTAKLSGDPDNPKAPQWVAARDRALKGLATIAENGCLQPQDNPVGVLVGAPAMGGKG